MNNFDRDLSNTDEYFMTAVQIFDCCGVDSSGALRVDALMDKFAPFVKTNKADFSYLSALMDPDQCNPEINVTKLANALHKYSETQKTKMDLDESFNLKGGQAPQDSDSGISSDGLQLLEELQGELREREHQAAQLRAQLDFSDRQHDEAIAALTAERDALRKHLNLVREENASLSHLRQEHEETSERLAIAEASLETALAELDAMRRRHSTVADRLQAADADKLTLQELLEKSKAECHRINEMYAARQAALLEHREALGAERAELAARLQDQEDFMQQVLKEKVHLEMELKDLLNKSNQTYHRLDRSIDVSYTDEQMLTALDSLNVDSRFAPENRILDEESFNNALKEDQGRSTNMSLFDEIRYSFLNLTGLNAIEKHVLDSSMSSNSVATAWTQTDEGFNDIHPNEPENKADCSVDSVTESRFDDATDHNGVSVDTQTDGINLNAVKHNAEFFSAETQTDDLELKDSYKVANKAETCSIETQTCEKLSNVDRNKVEHACAETQTIGIIVRNRPIIKRNMIPIRAKMSKTSVETQTDVEMKNNNSNDTKCIECNTAGKQSDSERDVKFANLILSEVQLEIAKYEENLIFLQGLIDEGNDKNKVLLSVVEDLNIKIGFLEAAYEKQMERLNEIMTPEVCCVTCQTECEHASVSTQVSVPCVQCERRNAVVPHRTLRRFFWEPLKSLFQVFAVVCFVAAVCVLCGVLSRSGGCRAAPWRWLHAQELMDLLLRIEYTAEVPM